MSDRFDDPKYVMWARAVKVDGNWTCQLCSSTGSYLESHHLNSWDWAVEERYILLNGTSLCKNCHQNFHLRYGYGNNTKFQFQEYKEIYQLLIKVAKNDLDGYSLGG